MEIQRRLFLGSLGAGALAATAEASAAAQAASAPAAGNAFDMSWTDRVKGKHRAVFDSPQLSGGAAVSRAAMWRHQYKEVYGTPPEDMTAIVVVRAEGIWLAMNDEFWKTYKVGESENFKVRHSDKFLTANPVAVGSPDDSPDEADMNITSLVASGGIVLACNMAFRGVVGLVKKTDKLSEDDARKKALTYLLPGVLLQPSGVFAALRAQEAGCAYIVAS